VIAADDGLRSSISANAALLVRIKPLDVNLLHQFRQDLFEPPVTDERGGSDLGEPPFNVGPLICFARVGVVLG
jgi:hypothetical protein